MIKVITGYYQRNIFKLESPYNMYQKVFYQGKQSDCNAAILLMALENIGVKNVPHPDCLTTRSFTIRCPRQNPSLWFSPFVTPLEGLLTALKILNVQYSCQVIANSLSEKKSLELFRTIEHFLRDGMIILGPLNRTKIWNRINSRYYKGDAYFILIMACYNETHLLVHDPEGCPYFLLSKDKFFSAISGSNFEIGIVQLHPDFDLPSDEEIYFQVLLSGIKSIIRASSQQEGGSNGLRVLTQEIASRKLKSSVEGVLYFAVPALSLSASHLAEFLSDFPPKAACKIANWDEVVPAILNLLCEEKLYCAQILELLSSHNQKKISEQFGKLANNRKLLEKLFVSVKFKSHE